MAGPCKGQTTKELLRTFPALQIHQSNDNRSCRKAPKHLRSSSAPFSEGWPFMRPSDDLYASAVFVRVQGFLGTS